MNGVDPEDLLGRWLSHLNLSGPLGRRLSINRLRHLAEPRRNAMERGKVAETDVQAMKPQQKMGPGQEKTWGECGIEEKVERLRRVLGDVGMVAARAERIGGDALEGLVNHRHDTLGLPVTPIGKAGGMGSQQERSWATRGLE